MRQPNHDFHVNPHVAIGTQEIGQPSMSAPLVAHSQVFTKNLFVSKAHTFCSKGCVDLSSGKMSEAEANCLDSCLNKYSMANSMLAAERKTFNQTLADIRLNGGDIYQNI